MASAASPLSVNDGESTLSVPIPLKSHRKLPLQAHRVKLDSPEGTERNAEVEVHGIADPGGAEGR
jgi:hypothetical protein